MQKNLINILYEDIDFPFCGDHVSGFKSFRAHFKSLKTDCFRFYFGAQLQIPDDFHIRCMAMLGTKLYFLYKKNPTESCGVFIFSSRV